jgi:hypothetical protein
MRGLGKKFGLFVKIALLAAGVMPARAGGPLYVTGYTSEKPGQPYRWILNPVPYKTDRGGLGNQTNTGATALVRDAFQAWQDVDTADIRFDNVGQLDFDVTANNVAMFMNAIGNCSNPSYPTNAIVYDLDGSIITALGMDNNSVLGFAGHVCSDDDAGVYTRGWSVLNGRFINGQPSTASHRTVDLDTFKATFIHEFGHLLGLDHSQINLNCLTDITCPAEDLLALPTMFPVLVDESQATPKTDDRAMLSLLYPAPHFNSTTGRIQGRVFFADGRTQAQGYNVIARRVQAPRSTAVSCVSGFLYTAGVGDPFAPSGMDSEFFFGSRDQTLLGYYDIAGLHPGDYTIEVEAINNSGDTPFVNGSGVGPIGSDLGFQFKMPGICNLQFLHYPSSPGDSCSAKSILTMGAGEVLDTQTDVILLGTPPRLDAWEDEP